MKYLFMMTASALIVSAVIAVGCTSLKTEAETGAEVENKAVYEGAAMGYRGIIRVRVGLNGGTITDIAVVESSEDRNVGEAAIEELTDLVLMYNTTEIDAVSGATETSRGFLEAIENAILDP